MHASLRFFTCRFQNERKRASAPTSIVLFLAHLGDFLRVPD